MALPARAHTVDYWLTRERLWAGDAVVCPEPETAADEPDSDNNRENADMKLARFFLGWCFVFLIVSVMAWTATYSPSFQKCIGEHADPEGPEKAADRHNVVVRRSAAIPPFLLCEGAFIDKNNGTLTALATIAIAGFTLTLWRATTEQGRLTRDALKLARDEFIASHRPRLRVYAFEVSDLDLPHDRPVCVLFRAQNIGETAARISKVEGNIFISSRNSVPLEPDIPFRFTLTPDIALQSGEPEQFSIENGPVVTELDFASIYTGQTPLVCIGRVTYLDDNGINRELGFCRKFSFRPYGSETVNNPEYEYAY